MSSRVLLGIALLLCCWGALLAQKPFATYQSFEYGEDYPLPRDYDKPTEWTRARLKYTDIYGGSQGPIWTMDYPPSDRHLMPGIRRLTRIDARSVEQIVELDGSDDVFNWPFMYAVEVGHWTLSPKEARQLRDYINRGGFLMVDDFHGNREWETFIEGLNEVFPDRLPVDLENSNPIFHTLYDLDQRVQIPGWGAWQSGVTYEQPNDGGRIPHWRGIFDDKGRVVVAICHNMDLGDAWEHADNPKYPADFTTMAYRIAIDYVTYHLTH